jgi:hypothetical protein
MTQALARAAAQDAANFNAKKHGRKAWNRADYNMACRTFNRLFPLSLEMRSK